MTDTDLEFETHVEVPVLREHSPDARCLVVGAYKGTTMRYLLDHGATLVWGFEPQIWAYQECLASLERFPNIRWEVEPVALVPWETDDDALIPLYNYGTDAARMEHNLSGTLGHVRALNIALWYGIAGSPIFDFAVVNVEGAEYMLLPFLSQFCDRLLVQFHGPGPIPVSQLMRDGSRTHVGANWWLYA